MKKIIYLLTLCMVWASCRNQLVGRAAAALMVSGGVIAVFTNMISTPGRAVLEEARVPLSTMQRV